jgi:hypothetical protein
MTKEELLLFHWLLYENSSDENLNDFDNMHIYHHWYHTKDFSILFELKMKSLTSIGADEQWVNDWHIRLAF